MALRDLFEAMKAREQTNRSGRSVSAADLADLRDGEHYRPGFPELNAAWQWFQAGRGCVVAVLPKDREPVELWGDKLRDLTARNAAYSEISDSLFEQGINNVRSD
jgi:hypothetical protein